MNEGVKNVELSDVEETALLTLYAKAIESQSKDPILKDEKAEEMVRKIDAMLEDRTSAMALQLKNRTIDRRLVIYHALRTKKYDEYAQDFLTRNPAGTVVNIGCGMDTRFFRVDNGKLNFFDLDLPQMITFKKKMLKETKRYRMIGQSVLEIDWMDRISELQKPVIFLAEGVFMYLPEEDVKSLVLEMQKRFPGCELVCELTNLIWVEGFLGKLSSLKMKSRAKIGGSAGFQFGVSDACELETWHEGIELIEKWFYMDSDHPKLGWLRIFRNWRLIKNTQYTVRYRLNA